MNRSLDALVKTYNLDHPRLPLDVRVTPEGGCMVKICGNLDLETATGVKPAFERIVALMTAGAHLTVDLGSVNYISSTGVGLLTTVLILTRKNRIGFSLSRVRPPVHRVISLLGFETFMEIEAFDD